MTGALVIWWLIRDTFRQARADRLFALLLAASAACALACLTVSIQPLPATDVAEGQQVTALFGLLGFAVPGSIDQPTGGYTYDRRVIAGLRGLGCEVDIIDLGQGFPYPDASTRSGAYARLRAAPPGRPIVIDGLAFGVLPDAAEALRETHPLIALVHHPLALETGVTPDRVTTDGHDAYPRAIRTELGKHVRHRTSRYLNNRLEQDHRGIKDRCRPMLGLKSTVSATRYCRGYDERRNLLRGRPRMRQHVPAAVRRGRHMRKTAIVLNVLATA